MNMNMKLLLELVSLAACMAIVNSNPISFLDNSKLGPANTNSTRQHLVPASQSDSTATATASASTIPVGQIIQQCTVPNTFALTFDDGPNIYTDQILDLLRDNDVKATFFVNGNSKGSINDESNKARIRRQIAEGHQVASHTWSHADLTKLDRGGIESEMNQLTTALREIIGKAPTYMRAPFLATNDAVLSTLKDLNFHVIDISLDTLDNKNDSKDAIGNATQNFKTGLANGGTIELSHDIHQWTANVLVQEMINGVKAKGLRAVPVGECLGDPESNWYN